MSIANRSLALEEIKKSEIDIEDLLLGRHLSVSNTAPDAQPVCHVVKIKGSITVSF